MRFSIVGLGRLGLGAASPQVKPGAVHALHSGVLNPGSTAVTPRGRLRRSWRGLVAGGDQLRADLRESYRIKSTTELCGASIQSWIPAVLSINVKLAAQLV